MALLTVSYWLQKSLGEKKSGRDGGSRSQQGDSLENPPDGIKSHALLKFGEGGSRFLMRNSHPFIIKACVSPLNDSDYCRKKMYPYTVC